MIKRFEHLEKLTDDNCGSRGNLSFSIVNTENCGKRIKLSSTLLKELNSPKHVAIYVNENNTGVCIIPSNNGQTFSKGGTIYNSALIERITQKLDLDFTGRTSLSFNNITIQEEGNEIYAEIIIHPTAGNIEVEATINSSNDKNESNIDSEREAS